MNATHQPVAEQRSDQRSPHREQKLRPARRVGLVDRIALHVGVALVVWSRRPRVIQSHESRADLLQHQRDTLLRESAAERMFYLGPAQR